MIFITKQREEKPLFTAYVNSIIERPSNNGGTMKTYALGTSEKKQDESREYSSWFCGLIGNARKQCEQIPLNKGDRIAVYGFKQTNVSKKNPDGTYTKAFLNIAISDYVLIENQNNEEGNQDNPF